MVRRLAVVALLAAFAVPAIAQEPVTLEQGKKTISANALIATVDGNTVLGVMGQYGVLTTPKVEVGPTLMLGYGSGDGSNAMVGMIGAFVRLRTPSTSATVPYFTLGLNYAFSSGDLDLNETILQGGVGLDYFIKPEVSFFADLQAVKVLSSGSDTVVMSLMGLRFWLD
ncbi:MAG: hypothetical protein FJX72_09615 [Armatimonadetes bacterium]|nr:hypothetical protein [Armatimonadota bacterium]